MVLEKAWPYIKETKNRYRLLSAFKNTGVVLEHQYNKSFIGYFSSLLACKIKTNDENVSITALMTEQILESKQDFIDLCSLTKGFYLDVEENKGVPQLEAQVVMLNCLFEGGANILQRVMEYDGGETERENLKKEIYQFQQNYKNLYTVLKEYEPFKIHNLKEYRYFMKPTASKEQKDYEMSSINKYETIILNMRSLLTLLEILPSALQVPKQKNVVSLYLRFMHCRNSLLNVYENNLWDNFTTKPKIEVKLSPKVPYDVYESEEEFKLKNPTLISTEGYLEYVKKQPLDFNSIELVDVNLFNDVNKEHLSEIKNIFDETVDQDIQVKKIIYKKSYQKSLNTNSFHISINFTLKSLEQNGAYFINLLNLSKLLPDNVLTKDVQDINQGRYSAESLFCLNVSLGEHLATRVAQTFENKNPSKNKVVVTHSPDVNDKNEKLVVSEILKYVKDTPNALMFGFNVKKVKEILETKENSKVLNEKLKMFYQIRTKTKEFTETNLKNSSLHTNSVLNQMRFIHKAFEIHLSNLEWIMLKDYRVLNLHCELNESDKNNVKKKHKKLKI